MVSCAGYQSLQVQYLEPAEVPVEHVRMKQVKITLLAQKWCCPSELRETSLKDLFDHKELSIII